MICPGLKWIAIVFLFAPAAIQSSPVINVEDHPPASISMHQFATDQPLSRSDLSQLKRDEKKLVRAEKRMKRFHKFTQTKKGQKRINGFSDPVDRWFWFWVVGWGVGIFLSVVAGGTLAGGGIALVWFLFFVAGAVSLIVWLLKKFGQ